MSINCWKIYLSTAAALVGTQPAALSLDVQLSANAESTNVPNLFCIRLSAVNLSSNQSVQVAADKAVIQDGSAELKPLSPKHVYSLLNQSQRRRKKRDEIAATLISGGLATMTVGDIIDKKESNTAWLGKINKRRNSKDTLFAERVLLPLDHSDGLLYFTGPMPSKLQLRIPSGNWPSDPAVPMTNQTIDVAASSQ
jgi:hypothetical protein